MDDKEESSSGAASGDAASPKPGCCPRLRAEFSSETPWFYEERGSRAVATLVPDTNGKIIDLPASFCFGTGRSSFSMVAKGLFAASTLTVLIHEWITSEDPDFFLAYLTNWSMVYNLVCLGSGFALSCLSSESVASRPGTAGVLLKTYWVGYLLAATHGMVVTLVYWLVLFDYGNSAFRLGDFFTHGGGLCLVLLDGLWLSRVPVRLKHFAIVFLSGVAYSAWGLLQAYLPVSNPTTDETGEEQIYNILDWRDAPVAALVCNLGILLVIFPATALLVWRLSLPYRRYAESNGRAKLQTTGHLDEEPSEAWGAEHA